MLEYRIFVTVILKKRMKKLLLQGNVALLLSPLFISSLEANVSFSTEIARIHDGTKYNHTDRKKINTHPKPKPEVFRSSDYFEKQV